MARKGRYVLPYESKIEVVAIKGDTVHVSEMEYQKALSIKKKNGWTYKFYQIGFSQFKTL